MNPAPAQSPSPAPAADAPVAYALAPRDGRLVIADSRGGTHAWTSYTLTSHKDLALWEQMHEPFFAAGVQLYQLQIWPGPKTYFTNTFWPGVDPELRAWGMQNLQSQVDTILRRVPDARFMIRIRTHPDVSWRDAHQEHFQPVKQARGGASHGQDAHLSVMSSWASETALALTEETIADHIAWCESQPWRDRIVGYVLLPLGEGGTHVANLGTLFDRSPVMLDAWHRYLEDIYPSDADLQAAWNSPDSRRDSVPIPTEAEWFKKKASQGIMHWPEPAQVRRERDYFRLQQRVFHHFWRRVIAAADAATAARPCLVGVDNYKAPQHGWLHNPGFFGKWDETTLDRHGAWQLVSGCTGIAPLLDMPELDVVWTPGMYYNRAMGYAWETEGVTDSLVLRGKLNFTEGDFRGWGHRNLDGTPSGVAQIADAGAALNPDEGLATYRRALAWAFTRNQMFWFCSVYGGNWWFQEPTQLPAIRETARLVEQSLDLPWHEIRDAVCLVIDDESAFYEDFSGGFQHLAVNRQIEEGLALCGLPYRIHLLSDLARDDFPAYRTWLFPNLFCITDDTLALLRAKVLRDGNVAIFGPGTGITDGVSRSAEPASKLLGLPMELVNVRSSRRLLVAGRLARQLDSQFIGESYSYGPLLLPAAQRLPADSGARPLGSGFYYHNLDRPGAFVRETGRGAAGNGRPGPRGAGDAALLFVPAVPLPADFIRECARFAGSHIYSEQNAVVYASRDLVSLHVPAAGDWTLQLPRPARVLDLTSGQLLQPDGLTLSLRCDAPYTWLLRLLPAE